MPNIVEGAHTFQFDNSWHVIKYDDSTFFKKRLNKIAQIKAVDIVAIQGNILYLIEVKDYRIDLDGFKSDSKIVNGDRPRLLLEPLQKLIHSIAGLRLGGNTDFLDFNFNKTAILKEDLIINFILYIDIPSANPGASITATNLNTQNYNSSSADNLRLKFSTLLKPLKIKSQVFLHGISNVSDIPFRVLRS